eukprot:Hpha_TRINITY_DN12859_c0_g1::TRINITY_DN12859_c0_g1_i1::g.24159::m.24159
MRPGDGGGGAASLFSKPMPQGRGSPQAVRIPAEQLQKSVDRLHGVHRSRPQQLEPITPRRVLSKEQQDVAVNRLYHETILRRKAQLEALQRKRPDFQRLPKTLPGMVIDTAVARLHDETMDRRRQDKEKLSSRFLAEKLVTRKMDKEGQATANSRLYDEAMAKQKQKRELLEAKLLGPLPTLRLATRAQ